MRRNRVNEMGMHLESFSHQFPGDKGYIGICKGCKREKQLHPSKNGIDYCNDCKRRKKPSNPAQEQPLNPYKRNFMIHGPLGPKQAKRLENQKN
jgi:hypothetical protein